MNEPDLVGGTALRSPVSGNVIRSNAVIDKRGYTRLQLAPLAYINRQRFDAAEPVRGKCIRLTASSSTVQRPRFVVVGCEIICMPYYNDLKISSVVSVI